MLPHTGSLRARASTTPGGAPAAAEAERHFPQAETTLRQVLQEGRQLAAAGALVAAGILPALQDVCCLLGCA